MHIICSSTQNKKEKEKEKERNRQLPTLLAQSKIDYPYENTINCKIKGPVKKEIDKWKVLFNESSQNCSYLIPNAHREEDSTDTTSIISDDRRANNLTPDVLIFIN